MIPVGRIAVAGLRLAAMAVIVTAAAGCDNVTWAGVDVRLQPAEPPPGSLLPEEAAVEEPGLPPLPAGDVVYLVRRDGAAASAWALVSMEAGAFLPLEGDGSDAWTEHFVQTLLPAGSELVLFADGARVGTFVARDSFEADGSLCIPRPRVDGILELVPGAADADVYLGVPASRAADVPRGTWSPPESTVDIRTTSLNLAGELMNELAAPWPQGTVAAIRRDLTLMTPPPSGDSVAPAPPFAATFINEDLLRVGDAARGAWSLFYVARHDGTRYRPTLVRYSLYQRDGKAAPRLLAWADLDGDGSGELLLEVFGARDRWLALAGFDGTGWTTLFEDPCIPVVEEEVAGNPGG